MLDLKELERKIDAQLAKETPRSLKKWLYNYRNRAKRYNMLRRLATRRNKINNIKNGEDEI
jgi:hypothetical protein